MTDWSKEPIEIELYGVTFVGRYDPSTGRVYIPSTPESKAGLTVLKGIGQSRESASVGEVQLTEEPNAHSNER